MKNKMDLMIHLLDCLEEAIGFAFIWKTTSSLLLHPYLPTKHRMHVQPFCLCVKTMGHEYCMRNDMEQISRRALSQRTAFINICHAGVAELVVPIFRGDYYLGAILCGPFLTATSQCVYPNTTIEYHRLPQISESRAIAIADIVSRVMQDADSDICGGDDNVRKLPEPYQIEDIRIREAMIFMQGKFRYPITVSEIARRSSLSKSRFIHLFKIWTGLSYSEYLQRLRIGEASRLILGTGLRMSEIADACGISEQSRFSALFKRYYHSTPMAYRKQNSKNKTT